MRSNLARGVRSTSPIGRGRRAAPGEGLQPVENPYALTPTLSPWEREYSLISVGSGEVK
jgi:hypothetical protein